MSNTHPVSLALTEDGTYVCVSLVSPRFAVGAGTKEEAKEKAARALVYFEGVDLNAIPFEQIKQQYSARVGSTQTLTYGTDFIVYESKSRVA